MAIDGCPHTFLALATTLLPHRMQEMRTAIGDPQNMVDFAEDGVGLKTLLQRFRKPQDFPGCYVLLDKKAPIYTGISRGVVGRIIQHVKGKTHTDASLAYAMAERALPHSVSRDNAMKDPRFQAEFQRAQRYLRSLEVAFIEIPDDLELYLFEVYCSMELNTHKWNTFRTH